MMPRITGAVQPCTHKPATNMKEYQNFNKSWLLDDGMLYHYDMMLKTQLHDLVKQNFKQTNQVIHSRSYEISGNLDIYMSKLVDEVHEITRSSQPTPQFS
jgi:hypothetical protein